MGISTKREEAAAETKTAVRQGQTVPSHLRALLGRTTQTLHPCQRSTVTGPHRTSPDRTAPHRTAPHRTMTLQFVDSMAEANYQNVALSKPMGYA